MAQWHGEQGEKSHQLEEVEKRFAKIARDFNESMDSSKLAVPEVGSNPGVSSFSKNHTLQPTVLRTAVVFTASLVGGAYAVLFSLILFADWGLPSWFLVAWLLGVAAVLATLAVRYEPDVQLQGPGSRSEWTFILNVFVAMFAVGGAMLAFSAVNSPAVTHSGCFEQNVTVTSPECKVVEATTLLSNDLYGAVGRVVIQAGLVSILILAFWFLLFYIIHAVPRKSLELY